MNFMVNGTIEFCQESYQIMANLFLRDSLVNEKGYEDTQLPSRQTIGTILNRLGYRLKKHKR